MSISSSSLTRNFSQGPEPERESRQQNGFNQTHLGPICLKSPPSSPEHKNPSLVKSSSIRRNVSLNCASKALSQPVTAGSKSKASARKETASDSVASVASQHRLTSSHDFERRLNSSPSPPSTSSYGKITRREFLNKLRLDDECRQNGPHDGHPARNLCWVEIFEPKCNYYFYANFKTGQFQFEEPRGVPIFRVTEAPQWFELYDEKSQRFYYYSGKDNKTTWHKPSPPNLVIPITKLNYIQSNSKAKNGDSRNGGISGDSNSTGPVCAKCAKTATSSREVSTQTPSAGAMTKAPMVSRWTQTTNPTSAPVRLSHASAGTQPVAQKPSLHHYLLSEARFAKGLTAGPNAGSDQLYDQVNEEFYDMVPNDNYCDVYDEDDEDLVIGDGSEADSWDADDEFDVESGDEEEEDDEFVEEEDEEEEAEEEGPNEYESVEADFESLQSKFENGVSGARKGGSTQADSARSAEEGDSTLDRLRMSNSFTAVDFKRNSSERKSFTPSLHYNQPASSKPSISYSNPFNMGSLRRSTGMTSTANSTRSSNIADRIQMFNQKAVTAPNPSAPQQPLAVHSVLPSKLTPSAPHPAAPKPTPPLHLQTPTKSHSLSFISQQHRSSESPALTESSLGKTSLSPEDCRRVISPEQSQLNSNRSSWSKHLSESPTCGKHSFDSMETRRKTSTPISESSQSLAGNHLSFSVNSFRGQLSGFNDSHQVMLTKTSSGGHHFPPHVQTVRAAPGKSSSPPKEGKHKKPDKKEKIESVAKKASKAQKVSATKKSAVGEEKKKLLTANNSIESFARECVSRHRKGGIFSKKNTLKSMLTHTRKALKKPMISTISDSTLVKESVTCFKLIQVFMGDRPGSPAAESNPLCQSSLSDEQVLMQLINVCVQLVPLRDEVLVQVARQVTRNPCPDSERRGLELMCSLFWYFTASNKLASHLHAFLSGHHNPFTRVVIRKFEQQMNRSRHTHSHLFFRKPHSQEEVSRVLRCVRSQHVGLFGETLADAVVLEQSEAKPVHRSQLAWPVILLTEALLEPRHEDREGVFRCVGDMDDVHRLKMKIDTTLPSDPNFAELIGRRGHPKGSHSPKLTDMHDIHVIASTLKLYFRELRDSVIPAEMYLEALECAHSSTAACTLLDRLASANRHTLRYLIRFLQGFSAPDQVRHTKMDDANLSMVWAPNILRSPLNVPINSSSIYEHTRAEMSLVRTLIQHLETQWDI